MEIIDSQERPGPTNNRSGRLKNALTKNLGDGIGNSGAAGSGEMASARGLSIYGCLSRSRFLRSKRCYIYLPQSEPLWLQRSLGQLLTRLYKACALWKSVRCLPFVSMNFLRVVGEFEVLLAVVLVCLVISLGYLEVGCFLLFCLRVPACRRIWDLFLHSWRFPIFALPPERIYP